MTHDSLQPRHKTTPPDAGLEISGSRKEDLEKARALETAQYAKALDGLEEVERPRRERILDEMARRGLQNSDACRQALLEARLDTLSQAVRRRVAIRRDLLRLYPELGSAKELDRLMERIHGEVSAVWEECQKSGLLVAPEVFAGLRKKGQEAVDQLRIEGLAARPKTTSVSPAPPKLPVSSAPAPISPGAANPAPKPKAALGSAAPPAEASPELAKAFSVVEQLTQELGSRNANLATTLLKLARAVRDSRGLGSERASYMDQLQFLAEQALRPAVLRRRGVVQGLLISWQNEVERDAVVALLRWEAGALLASHFGLRWAPAGKPGMS